MAKRRMVWQTWVSERVVIFGSSLLVFLLAILVVYKFIDPAPPKHFVISTGEESGNDFQYGKEYQAQIKLEGIDLEVRPSKGAWDNLALLGDPKSGVDVAFVQDGLGTRKKNPGLLSLGSVSYEPIWVFYHGKTEFTRFTHFTGKTVALGEKGGETHTMAKKLLKASGVDETNAHLLDMTMEEEVKALRTGGVDVAFFMGPPDNLVIADLLHDQKLRVMSVDQAEAITRQIPYLHHLVLPHGTIDLAKNIPNVDVDLVAPTATLLVRDTIHPALVYLLLKAAAKVHRGPGIFEKRKEFPEDKDFAFALHSGAKTYYQSGAPFWLRYLPFWLATLVERFVFLVIPIAAVIIPIIRSVPRFLKWRVRNRIYQRYGELKFLEGKIKAGASQEERAHYLEQLDRIEDRVNGMKIPLDFSDYVYSLRGHIHFVRERLLKLIA